MNIHSHTLIDITEAVKAYESLNKNIMLGVEMSLFEEGEHIATITGEGVELEDEYFG